MTESPAAGVRTQAGPAGPGDPSEHHARRLTQVFVVLGAALSFWLCWNAGKLLYIPVYRHFESSLLQQPGFVDKLLAFVAVPLLVLACTVVSDLIGGRHWHYAGVFGAAVGLSALSIRGGPSRYVYFHAADGGYPNAVFVSLIVESLLLFACLGAAWLLLAERERAALEPDQPKAWLSLTPNVAERLLTQVVLGALVILIFTPTDDKKAVLASAFLGCFIGTSLAEQLFKGQKAIAWYWIGPCAIGVLGYALTGISGGGSSLAHAQPDGLFAPLARPLPLDYASFGSIGALLGYWVGAAHPHPGGGGGERPSTPPPASGMPSRASQGSAAGNGQVG